MHLFESTSGGELKQPGKIPAADDSYPRVWRDVTVAGCQRRRNATVKDAAVPVRRRRSDYAGTVWQWCTQKHANVSNQSWMYTNARWFTQMYANACGCTKPDVDVYKRTRKYARARSHTRMYLTKTYASSRSRAKTPFPNRFRIWAAVISFSRRRQTVELPSPRGRMVAVTKWWLTDRRTWILKMCRVSVCFRWLSVLLVMSADDSDVDCRRTFRYQIVETC